MTVMAERRRQALNESRRLRDRRYPLANLAPHCIGGTVSYRNLRATTGIAHNVLRRVHADRYLTEQEADLIACRMGKHPSEIWPEWWEQPDPWTTGDNQMRDTDAVEFGEMSGAGVALTTRPPATHTGGA